MPLRLLYCQWMTTRPIQYKVMPIRPNNATQITLLLMNDHLTNPIPIQCHLTVTVLPIGPNNATQIALLPMNGHSTNPIPIQCHLTVTVMPIRPKNATQIALLPMNGHLSYPIQSNANQTKQCHSDCFTANEWPLDQSNTNPVPLDCQGDANQTRKYTQITLLPMNDLGVMIWPIDQYWSSMISSFS